MKKLLTAKEVSRILDTDIQRVWELTRKKLLPCVRLGQRQLRFNPDDIEHFIQQGGNSNTSEGLRKKQANREQLTQLFNSGGKQ